MKAYYITDTGKVRTHNEDSVMIVKNLIGEHLMVVADGMGGHKAGEVASSIAINHLTNAFNELEKLGDKADTVKWIRKEVTLQARSALCLLPQVQQWVWEISGDFLTLLQSTAAVSFCLFILYCQYPLALP